MKLQGLNLEVKNISRKGIEGSDMAYCCDNCGKTIVNYATVSDGFKTYIIGLDCKKNLIDKKFLDGLKSNDFMEKYEAKEYRKNLNEVNKFLLESSRENVTLNIQDNYLMIYDYTKQNTFGMLGLNTYGQNLAFLYKMGLKDYIINKINNQDSR
jgi:hypothetical protein